MNVAGVDVGGTRVLALSVDEQGRVLSRQEQPTDPVSATGTVIQALTDIFERSSPSALGVAAAAWVERPSGRILFAPNVRYADADLRAVVEERFGVPVYIENDANAAAWAEFRFGAARGSECAVMLTLGTGVGGGAVIEGRLFIGSGGIAGEFGHMTIDEDGPRCACGLQGCLEAMASGTAIERMAAQELGKDLDGEEVAEMAKAGDERATAVFTNAGRYLGIGIANLISAFDPDVVVVGGGVASVGDLILEPARREVARRFENKLTPPPLVAARLGNDGGAIGAADLSRLMVEK